MPRLAGLAVVLALLASPARAEPYRPLPRHSPEKVRERISESRASQKLHEDAPVQPASAAPQETGRQGERKDEIRVIATPPLPASRRDSERRATRPPDGMAPAVAVEAKPSLFEVKPSPVEVKPSLVEVKPSPVAAKPSLVEAKPSLVEVKPSPVEVKPSPVAAKPSPAAPQEAQPQERPLRAPAGEAVAAAIPASPKKVAPRELKVSVVEARPGGRFVMLVEDPSGARIELLLDGSGRLLSVRPAGTF